MIVGAGQGNPMPPGFHIHMADREWTWPDMMPALLVPVAQQAPVHPHMHMMVDPLLFPQQGGGGVIDLNCPVAVLVLGLHTLMLSRRRPLHLQGFRRCPRAMDNIAGWLAAHRNGIVVIVSLSRVVPDAPVQARLVAEWLAGLNIPNALERVVCMWTTLPQPNSNGLAEAAAVVALHQNANAQLDISHGASVCVLPPAAGGPWRFEQVWANTYFQLRNQHGFEVVEHVDFTEAECMGWFNLVRLRWFEWCRR